jgi:REP element-mobilizing transposase RayT
MPQNHKVFFHRYPIEITTSVRRGLPFVATQNLELIIKGVLAAAQTKYPVIVCGYVVMQNHIHLILVVQDPEDVPRFMDYFKTETAHIINRLLGRTGQSFWCKGYDSPVILTPTKVLERMKYVYLNPINARYCSSIKQYRGMNSFQALFSEKCIESHKKISRSEAYELEDGDHTNQKVQKELTNHFTHCKGIAYNLVVEPWAWMKCFKESKGWNISEVRKRFIESIESLEKGILSKFDMFNSKHSKFQLSMNVDMKKDFKSERDGKKMICLSDSIELRVNMISKFSEEQKKSRLSNRLRKLGDRFALPPPGFFLPGGGLIANIPIPQIMFGLNLS